MADDEAAAGAAGRPRLSFWQIIQLLRLIPELLDDLQIVLPVVKKWIVKLESIGIIRQGGEPVAELRAAVESLAGRPLSSAEKEQFARASNSWGAG